MIYKYLASHMFSLGGIGADLAEYVRKKERERLENFEKILGSENFVVDHVAPNHFQILVESEEDFGAEIVCRECNLEFSQISCEAENDVYDEIMAQELHDPSWQ